MSDGNHLAQERKEVWVLTRLMPDQISRYWSDIKATLRYNLLPIANAEPEQMNRLLEQLISGEMQAWVIIQDGDCVAMVITTLATEPGAETRNLLIYSAYGYTFVKPESWKSALETLRKFAEALECKEIIAYTKVERVITISKELGADVDYRLIKLEV